MGITDILLLNMRETFIAMGVALALLLLCIMIKNFIIKDEK